MQNFSTHFIINKLHAIGNAWYHQYLETSLTMVRISSVRISYLASVVKACDQQYKRHYLAKNLTIYCTLYIRNVL